jgi:hypothetical protein
MKHLRLFEEWNKERFASKGEQRDYYRNLNPIKPVEERTYNINQLKEFDIPSEIIDNMKSWDVIVKSPHSDTFYNSTEISWTYKPDGSFRVSDHWNFETRGTKHCLTETVVKNSTHVSLGQYDRKKGKYKILMTLPKPSNLQRIELARKKKEFMMNPEIIAQKKEFKSRIEKKEIIAEVTDKGKTYKGVVRKYTGRELKIENELEELIYNENYLDNQIVKLFDRLGNSIQDPFDVKFESIRYLKTFENFRGWSVSKLSNFSTEDLEDLLEEFQVIAENYGLKDWQVLYDEAEESEKGKVWDKLIEEGKSFYYVNTARNAFIEVIYFGLDKEEFIDDLKSFVNKMRSLNNWEIINSWSYYNGFSCEYGENENGDEYVHCDLVFHKKVNEGFFDFFKKKESEDDKIANQFIQRLEKIKGESPYEITDITRDKVPSWCYELPKSEEAEYYNKIYLIKFDDLDLIITNDRHSLVDNQTGQIVGEEKCKNQWKLLIGNDEIAERIQAKESIRRKIFRLVDEIYKRDKEVRRVQKIKREINPEADVL